MIQLRTLGFPVSGNLFAAFADALLPRATNAKTAEALQKIAQPMALRAGKTARLGEDANHLAFVAKGATKLMAQAAEGREQVLAFHFAGDIVWMPGPSAHAHSLVALRDTCLLVFAENEFLELSRREHELMAALLGRAVISLNRSRENALLLGRKTASERVATFLAAMVGRIGQRSGERCDLSLPMCRRDIADSLGMTVETVSRQFSELRATGLIETSGRAAVHIPDLRALEARAGYLHRSD